MKFGIIGLGNIGRVHAKNIQDGLVGNAELVAVANQPIESMDDFKAQGIACFGDASELIESGLCDAVIVALPTHLHAPIGIQALEAGLHLIMEKPLACHKAEGERILAARQSESQTIGLMMNQRTHPCYVKIKQWIDAGETGELQRVSWTMTNWFRPEIYYQSSPWRATWKGEGGGVLMNQCPHNIDVLQWLVGMPSNVRAQCSFGKYHDIEVEDEVNAYFEFPNGATGQFSASTGEAPGSNRLEIVGDLGTIITDGNEARLLRNSESVSGFSRRTDEMFGAPETTEEVYRPTEAVNQHAAILNNFVQAANGEAELIAPADAGLESLQLAGAMIFSTWIQDEVSLPLDSMAYEKAILEKIAQSKPREVLQTAAKVDMSKSYR
ncbi:scyllo-inositol 2-dehydrogenase (NAD(+)) [Pontiella desulfatans]|uniref:Scyllo-inositol 2-dehydrogenase (NAD(+)) n=1 Tax=Pontiella desulfatans TaxID=2750659 RepID=A0A6C2U1G9_PONDE|nr:Gfo/Idh/MocA family oxidoreductase [Pontiella desulfatans]VGO13723.1 scyllo-inositol 2-dehydrogenase (NAD(+)) [Pontiella desulfatans]